MPTRRTATSTSPASRRGGGRRSIVSSPGRTQTRASTASTRLVAPRVIGFVLMVVRGQAKLAPVVVLELIHVLFGDESRAGVDKRLDRFATDRLDEGINAQRGHLGGELRDRCVLDACGHGLSLAAAEIEADQNNVGR